MHAEVDAYLRRKHTSIIKEIAVVQKEDLDLKNHLSGLKRTLLKACPHGLIDHHIWTCLLGYQLQCNWTRDNEML